MILNSDFIKKFKGNFSENLKLSSYSWFNLGGNAEYFYKAQDKEQLIKFLYEAKKRNLKTTCLRTASLRDQTYPRDPFSNGGMTGGARGGLCNSPNCSIVPKPEESSGIFNA